jgi:signal recognition particle GTPase
VTLPTNDKMVEETEEEMETEDKEEMEEKVEEEKMEIEDVVKAIVAEVKDEMGKLRDEMKAIEDKVSKMEAAPAAEPTRTSTGKKMGATGRGFKAFNVEESLNADRIKMALNELKNKK